MNKRNINKLRKHLIAKCDEHIAKGGKVIDAEFHDIDGGCCPITCAGGRKSIFPEHVIGDAININFGGEDMWDFINGFDGNKYAPGHDRELFDLGRELRKKYIKSSKKKA